MTERYINVAVPSELHRKVAMTTAARQTTLKQVVLEALTIWLQAHPIDRTDSLKQKGTHTNKRGKGQ